MANCSRPSCPNRAHWQIAGSIGPLGISEIRHRFALNMGVCKDHAVGLTIHQVLVGDVLGHVRDGFYKLHRMEADPLSASLDLVRMLY